jgi:glycogen debranching enzyme
MRRYFYIERLSPLASFQRLKRTGMISPSRQSKPARFVCWGILVLTAATSIQAQELELTRAARPWEFLCATGTRAGIFGNEAGNFEAWVYPLKILRNFHLRFLVEHRSLPAESLVRTIIARPSATTIVYSGDTFSVKETLFVPIAEPGAAIIFEVETAHPLEIEAHFEGDFELEWPAALGGTYLSWEPSVHAFYFGEEQKKYVALLGSPTGDVARSQYQTNYSSSEENILRLGQSAQGKETKIIALAASVHGRSEAEAAYRNLLANYAAMEQQSRAYYRDYLSRTVSLELPDRELEQAYDWSRVSVIQGLVNNPLLGSGLVAGYRTSGTSQRPGFAWFFGRDSFWTDFALDAEGDFSTTRAALEFISRYQRADGKMPHEISQTASLVDWFTQFPYPYASVDATPLYIIAASDYVRESGDRAFVEQRWDSFWRAYEFLRSTYDARGWPQNFGFGHGWVEGGPLLPVKTEFYQSGLGIEALEALSRLARTTGRDELSQQLENQFVERRRLLNQVFWSADSRSYAFALDQNNQKIVEPSVLATVPMWFHLLDENTANQMLEQLAEPEHQTDWGMRIISSRSARYDAGGYHYGSVWPLFTGWASVGEYRYHRALPAYANLRANALLALDGSLGHVTEVLSGDYYQPLSTSSPHQIWSAAMVVSPLLRGLLGLETDELGHHVSFSPHLPADWSSVRVHRVQVGNTSIDFAYEKHPEELTLEIESSGDVNLEFSPAVSLRAEVAGARVNDHGVHFELASTAFDQHVILRTVLSKGKTIVRIGLRNDFALSYQPSLPGLGKKSRELHIVSQTWSPARDAVTLNVAGLAGVEYSMALSSPEQVASVEGGELKDQKLRIRIPEGESAAYEHQKVTIHLAGKRH